MIVQRIDEQTSFVVRIIVIDDNEPFRRYVCTKLQEKPGSQIAGEAADGLEALYLRWGCARMGGRSRFIKSVFMIATIIACSKR